MNRKHPEIVIRRLEPGDLPAALAIQSETYPVSLIEDEQAFASRLDLAASYCLAATREGELVGYLLAHGWPRQAPSAVGAVVAQSGVNEVLFIHDLAVSSAGRGSGAGRTLIARAFELAARDGLPTAELIAVKGAASYWRKLGFVEAAVPLELAEKIATYGHDARWMTRQVIQAGFRAGHGAASAADRKIVRPG